ncbi:MAG TPA: septation protein IspZ [Stellaceae bacterium]|nr:septation protein IspZ [Stellaceae bacterium]
MKQALRQLAGDFLSAIVFFALYAVTGNLYLGVGMAIAVGLAQVGRHKLAGRAVEPMQWMSLGLVVVLGGATILFHTPRFVMLKPTIAHLAVAAVMLRRGWMTRYLPPIAQQYLDQSIIDAAGYGWAALQVALAVTNVVLALEVSIATWAWFISFANIAATATALGLQYLVFRAIVRRRIIASRLVPAVAAVDAAS